MTEPHHEIHRQLGALEARLGILEQEVAMLRTSVAQILEILNQTRGGWRTLVLLGGVAGAIGALVAKGLPVLFAASVPR